MKSYKKLLSALDYQFSDISLLDQAFTHRSAAKVHNERLEFLGDAVLGMVVADVLYQQFPNEPEGKLTRMRSSIVKGDTLALIAKEHQFGDYLKLGSGEMKSGGHRRSSILADAVEAVIGAIYLESGIDAASNTINKLFASRLEKLDPNIQIKDNKTQLQEYLQSRQLALPQYEVVSIKGKDHAQTFEVNCTVEPLNSVNKGVGKSRRQAEQNAAKITLEKLSHD
ncbi:ribonuclease III [Glaciecola sp. MH2013]|uniref:ribonuclease III n=1 Tax=Glaciecola sp. MH2013 TaxID=2785524 RepID=UPI00189D5710|nr:ribonuclease III [Glaciecola sp. MH2013]MBF7074726.1 ribonuclease III [Glaciecola sp. MH2013]